MAKVRLQKLRGKLHVKHGWSFKGEHFADAGDHILLTPGNFQDGGGFKFDPEKAKYYADEFPEEYLCAKDDLVVVLTEQTPGLLGCAAFVPDDGRFLHNQRIGLVTVDEQLLDKAFAYYLFNTKGVGKQLRASSSGSKVKHTSPERIYDVLAPIPELEKQKRIASVLSSLDAKITLNQRINAELEAMAKLLYDYWFVQFDFPMSAAQAKRLGKPKLEGKPYKSSGGPMVYNAELKREVPEGWDVDTLGNHLTIERGISYSSPDIAARGTPMINLDSFTLEGRYKVGGVKYFNGTVKPGKHLQPGDLMIAATDVTRNAHIIGKSFLLPNIFEGPVVASTDIAKVVVGPKLNKYVLHMLFNSDYYHRYIKGFANGTLVLHLDVKGVNWFKMPIPPLDLQLAYQVQKEPIEKKIAQTMLENQELASLRDWLLPLLMNGQVVVGSEDQRKERSVDGNAGLSMAAEPC